MTEKELREKRAKLVHDGREILAFAEKEKRELTAEEGQRWDAIALEEGVLTGHIDRLMRQAESERALEEPAGRRTQPAAPGEGNVVVENGTYGRHSNAERAALERSEAFRAWFLAGSDRELSERQIEVARRHNIDVRAKNLHISFPAKAPRTVHEARTLEYRAGSVGTGTAGGYTVAQGFWRSLEEAMLAFGGMREVSSVIRTDGVGDLPIPTANDTNQKGVILAENTQVAEQDITYGQIVLKSFKYSSKMTRLSVELLEDSAFDIEAFTGDALGTRIGRITNDHFTTGAGTTEPKGIVTCAALGKAGTTGQVTSIIFEDLVDLVHSVDPSYRTGARFMFADSTLKAIKKLKDGQGRPLWLPGVAEREPDTILGYPYTINQSMAAMAASAKSVLFGQLSKYTIRDVVGVTLLRLDERFADYHQVAFLAFSRHDGNLLDAGVTPVKYYQNAAT